MNNIAGFALTLVAGASVGFSMWPLKWVRLWKWENFWLLYSIFSLIIVPFGLAFAVLPNLSTVYAALTLQEIMRPFLLGMMWGIAQLGAGICVHRLGLAVAGAVLNGIGAGVGTIAPLLSLHGEMVLTTSGLLILSGTVMMLIGASFCGWSGYLRETEARQRDSSAGFAQKQVAMRQSSFTNSRYVWTLGIAVLSGVISSLPNIALAYAGKIMAVAQDHGAQTSWAPFAVWPIVLLGGSVANIGYSVYMISKNKGWGRFNSGFLKEVLYPALSACLWMAGIALYSSGTTFLGSLGISIGFAVFMITMIISGQFAGMMTGEWHLMNPKTYKPFVLGVGILVVAVVMIGASRYVER